MELLEYRGLLRSSYRYPEGKNVTPPLFHPSLPPFQALLSFLHNTSLPLTLALPSFPYISLTHTQAPILSLSLVLAPDFPIVSSSSKTTHSSPSPKGSKNSSLRDTALHNGGTEVCWANNYTLESVC